MGTMSARRSTLDRAQVDAATEDGGWLKGLMFKKVLDVDDDEGGLFGFGATDDRETESWGRHAV